MQEEDADSRGPCGRRIAVVRELCFEGNGNADFRTSARLQRLTELSTTS